MKPEKSKNKKIQGKHSQIQVESKRKVKFFDLIGISVVILLGIILYSNSFDCSFHLDDEQNIVDNVRIRDLTDVKSLWNYSQTRFVAFYTFAVNYHFDELNVRGYHLVNLVIHLITSSLVYWLTILIFSTPFFKNHRFSQDKKIIALSSALLFVSHPLATQSVTYIVQRMSSMAAMFYLCSLVLFIKARMMERRNVSTIVFFIGAGITALLAMLTKENAFTLPLAILLVEIYFLRTKSLSLSYKDYRILLLIAAFIGFVILISFKYSFAILKPVSPNEHNNFVSITSLNYFFTQFSAVLKYIQLLLVPVNLNLDYDFPVSNHFFSPRTFFSFFLLLSLLVLSVYLFKRNRLISFCILWFFLTLSIESSIVPLSDVFFEHRTYLPSFGFFLLLSITLYKLFQGKSSKVGFALMAIVIVTNSYLTYERNKIWKDELSLWNDIVPKSPKKARAYMNRGVAFFNNKMNTEAMADFNKAIELQPGYSKAYYNRGTIYETQKNHQLAIEDYNKCIQLAPGYSPAYNNRGNIYKVENHLDLALADYSKSIELNPYYHIAYNNRGTIYVMEKKYAVAIEDFNKALELKPGIAEAYANRGVAELNLGEIERSCNDFKKAIDLGFKPVIDVYNQNCK